MRYFITLLITSVLISSCVKDRSIPYDPNALPVLGTRHLIHYWNFNTSDISTPTYTIGGASWSYAGTSDSVNDSTSLNARNGDVAGMALRLRNPAADFILSLPTTGCKNVVFTFAVLRTSNGAQTNVLSYTTDGINYTSDGLAYSINQVNTDWSVYSYDFSTIAAVNNNPGFKIKISFGNGNVNTSGNDRFDNITVDADILPVALLHYWNFNGIPATTITSGIGGGNLDFDFLTVGTTTGYHDSLVSTTTLNARNSDPAGNALRVRNPSKDMIITAPTTDYQNITVRFAVAKSNSGPITDSVYYSTDGVNFSNTGLSPVSYAPGVDPAFTLMSYNLINLPQVNNNPNFRFKIIFSNGNLGTSGNTRFDNLTVEGIHL